MKKKILIIEDEIDIRKNITTILEVNGYETICAPNGEIGLELAVQHLPDLIISDILMPKMDGYELLEELRKLPETFMIPFLFLTAKTERKDFRKGMRLGADDYLTKPFSIEELLECVKSRIEYREKYKLIFNQKFEQLRSAIRKTLPHEMRTPLNIILGFSDILLRNYDSIPPAETKDMLNNIYQAGRRLYDVIEKYIFYVNLEVIAANPKETANFTMKNTFSCEQIIKETAIHIADKYNRKDDLKYQIEDSALKISEELLSRIIEEIVDNAFKFSQKNTEVLLYAKKDSGAYNIIVTNFGKGLTSEQITSIGPFIQFDRKIYEQQGLGLGLSIAKKLTEMHNGSLAIESEVNYFTRVIIELPIIN